MLQPMYDYIVVEKIKIKDKTDTGLYLPENRKEQNICKVISVGPGYRQDDGSVVPLIVKSGDIILVVPKDSAVFEEGSKTYYILPERSVIAKLSEDMI